MSAPTSTARIQSAKRESIQGSLTKVFQNIVKCRSNDTLSVHDASESYYNKRDVSLSVMYDSKHCKPVTSAVVFAGASASAIIKVRNRISFDYNVIYCIRYCLLNFSLHRQHFDRDFIAEILSFCNSIMQMATDIRNAAH